MKDKYTLSQNQCLANEFCVTTSMTFCIKHLLILLLYFKVSSTSDTGYSVERANEYIDANYEKVNQKYRYKYHAMAPIGWINDPNGFIYFRGEYHLFYQYNPYSSVWDTMHWGHAKSKDLVTWERLPVALAPDQDYDKDGVFSGSAIEINERLYVMYTCVSGDLQQQCIAYSDDGVNFIKIQENPVIDTSQLPSNAQTQDFRDPKVFKRDDTYYVVLASKTLSETGQILLYQSQDFIDWEFKSILLEGTAEQGIMWECPDLFEIDGKDVLILSAIQMPKVGDDFENIDSVIEFVGTVNWETGILNVEYDLKEIDHGLDFYASQTLLDAQGRRIMIAWMQMWGRTFVTSVLGHGWSGGMTFPRELHLKEGYLVQNPVKEIENYYKDTEELKNVSFVDATVRFALIEGEIGVLEVIADLTDAHSFSIQLRASANNKTVISYDVASQELKLDRSESGYVIVGDEGELSSRKIKTPLINGKIKLQVFKDRSSVEIFVNDGSETFTAVIYPLDDAAQLIVFGGRGRVLLESVTLSSIDL